MDIEINRNYHLLVDSLPVKCNLVSLSDKGFAVFRGMLPDTQKLLIAGAQFKVMDTQRRQLAIGGTILKIEEKTLDDVTVLGPDEASVITLEVTAICRIDYCKFFEPVD